MLLAPIRILVVGISIVVAAIPIQAADIRGNILYDPKPYNGARI
jgi:hypothetical protein